MKCACQESLSRLMEHSQQAGKPASGFSVVHDMIWVHWHDSKLCFHWRTFQNEPKGISKQQKKARKSKPISLDNVPHSWSSRQSLVQLELKRVQTLWVQQKSLISFHRKTADWRKTCTGNQLRVGRGRSHNKWSVRAPSCQPRWLVVMLVHSCWGCAILYVFQMTGVTKQMVIQRVTAMPIFIVQFHPTVLAVVTFHMVILVHRHNPNGLIRPLRGQNGKPTCCTLWS